MGYVSKVNLVLFIIIYYNVKTTDDAPTHYSRVLFEVFELRRLTLASLHMMPYQHQQISIHQLGIKRKYRKHLVSSSNNHLCLFV